MLYQKRYTGRHNIIDTMQVSFIEYVACVCNCTCCILTRVGLAVLIRVSHVVLLHVCYVLCCQRPTQEACTRRGVLFTIV